jgi:hypothetical protein
MKEHQERYRPQSPMGKAIDYTLPRWAGLSVYTLHGQLQKKNKINEFTWLKDVFERIQSHKQNYLYQLLPSNWNQHRIN